MEINGESPSEKDTVKLKVATYNCKGFKQSIGYIKKLVNEYDIVCLNELWLWPAEISLIEKALDMNITAYAVSGMNNVGPEYTGRPFGGVAVICKNHPSLNYRELPSNSDRLMPVGVYDLSGELIQVICTVYMPYYKQCSEQTESFINTIEALQTIVDKYGSVCQVKFLGDLNVQLPRKTFLNKLWYRQKGYNPHCHIMYNFIEANNLAVADFMFKQDLGYTYFCDTLGVKSWIDHVLCFDHDSSVTSCQIYAQEFDNLSDHLPIIMTFEMDSCTKPRYGRNIDTKFTNQRVNWSNETYREKYKLSLEEKLRSLPTLQLDDVEDEVEIQQQVDAYINQLNSYIHEAAE
jgi:exonuclease III